jgi:uncharacterized repeat protein (TIGR03803 family)
VKSGTQQTSSVLSGLFLKLFLMLACLGLPVTAAEAQTFATLHSFTNSPDGANAQGGLILSGSTLYGTTIQGGSFGAGTVFRINANGTGLTNLHNFAAVAYNSGLKAFTNSEGAYPAVVLVLLSNTLYGTTFYGGPSANGVVFSLKTDGSGFTNLHDFTVTSGTYLTNSDGASPAAGLTASGNTLYGTTADGGSSGGGTVFAINSDGTGFTNLHSFVAGSDGSSPQAGLISSGNILYGTASSGGQWNSGTVFRINTNGTAFTNLYNFTQEYSTGNGDGAFPVAGLVLAGNTLYGTTEDGGSANLGVVFQVNTDGSSFTNLHSFTAFFANTNSDGALPYGGNLVISGSTLYGVASAGGIANDGTVFRLKTDGSDFTTLHSFSATSGANSTNGDGASPTAALLLSGGRLYGMAGLGGNAGHGTIFSLLASGPQLTIATAGTNVVLTWPTNTTIFSLEVATNLAPTAVWSTNSTISVIIGGQNVMTNAITGPRKFYRLISQ